MKQRMMVANRYLMLLQALMLVERIAVDILWHNEEL